jgi:maltooligosyltrehalose trehalohydrolase
MKAQQAAMMHAGSHYLGDGQCQFVVWAPQSDEVYLHLVKPADRRIAMQKRGDGYFEVEVDDLRPGATYFYQLSGKADRPDPASAYQPEGVHGPSQVVDHAAYPWKDNAWKGSDLKSWIIYELHIGTFSPEGTFAGAIGKLDYLADLGITAVEIMPVSQFPGSRNWGYDGVYPYSVQNSYGSPDDMKCFVEECHARGIAVILDIVYNHMGPEGNYLREFGPYFIEKYRTPWGDALNYDEEYADGVREFFSESAVYWLENYHLDGLRLDAIHSVFDMGAKHFWQLVNEKVQALSKRSGWKRYTIAESDLNDTKVIRPLEKGGYGFDSQWMDDLHHALHALLTGERDGYYSDYGAVEQVAKALQNGFVYDGVYSEYRKRKYGNASAGISGDHFVVCIQNHDQVGNRMAGDRISTLVSFEHLKLAAAAMLLSPYVPMLFMGEEYAEDNPYQYFISHTDKDLVEAVRQGRKREFEKFAWAGEVPDPQGEETFNRCKLDWQKTGQGKYKVMLDWYKTLIGMRKEWPALSDLTKAGMHVEVLAPQGLVMHRQTGLNHLVCFFNFGVSPCTYQATKQTASLRKMLSSTDSQWQVGNTKTSPSPEPLPDELGKTVALTLPPLSVTLYGTKV